jgi:hypothetical protein
MCPSPAQHHDPVGQRHRLDLVVGFQPEGKVLPHAHLRVERMGLKHHGQFALCRGHLVHRLAVRQHLPAGDLPEPGDHPQQGGLAAASGQQTAADRLGLARDLFPFNPAPVA